MGCTPRAAPATAALQGAQARGCAHPADWVEARMPGSGTTRRCTPTVAASLAWLPARRPAIKRGALHDAHELPAEGGAGGRCRGRCPIAERSPHRRLVAAFPWAGCELLSTQLAAACSACMPPHVQHPPRSAVGAVDACVQGDGGAGHCARRCGAQRCHRRLRQGAWLVLWRACRRTASEGAARWPAPPVQAEDAHQVCHAPC